MPKLAAATGNAADLEGENLNALLQRHGIGLPKQAMAGTAADAAVKAKEIGFPVAVKLIAAEVVHKTESGAVVLGLKSAEEVQAEGQKLLTKTLGRGHLLIQEMVQGTEVLIGARTDPQYGPFLMVGLGGIFVEVLKDVSIRLLPIDEREAREMLKELRGYKVLEGVRGQKPRDIDALVKAMVGLVRNFRRASRSSFRHGNQSDHGARARTRRGGGGCAAGAEVVFARKETGAAEPQPSRNDPCMDRFL